MRIPIRFGWLSIVGARTIARGIDRILRKTPARHELAEREGLEFER
jgi:hypothetical protein